MAITLRMPQPYHPGSLALIGAHQHGICIVVAAIFDFITEEEWGERGRLRGGGGGGVETTNSRQQDFITNFREQNNSHPPTPHPSTKSWVFKIFLTSSSNSCTTLHRGLREEQASFPLWSQQSIWINFVADWRINITARQPKTSLHPKKTRPISELKHTFRTTPR